MVTDRPEIDCAIITAVSNELNQLVKCGLERREYSEQNAPTQYYCTSFEKEGETLQILIVK